MRDEIPVTEQEEAAWREMERRQAQSGQRLEGEQIAARPPGAVGYAQDSGRVTWFDPIPEGGAYIYAGPQPPSGQSAAPSSGGNRLALNLAIDAIENAPPQGDEWPVNWPAILIGLKGLRDSLDIAQPAAATVPPTIQDSLKVAAPAVQAVPTPPVVGAVPLIARALAEWHEEDGPVMWWAWCGHEWAGEPPWCGTPLSSDWPGYHTHWTPMVAVPAVPAADQQAGSPQGGAE